MSLDFGAGERRLADYARRVEAIQQQAEETQARLRTLRARTTSADQAVTVDMAPGGRLERLTLSPEAMQYGPERLAALITDTIRQAHGAVAEQMQETMRPLIGDSPAMEFLRDQIDIAQREEPQAQDEPAEPASGSPLRADPARSQRPATDDDDDEGFGSVWRDR